MARKARWLSLSANHKALKKVMKPPLKKRSRRSIAKGTIQEMHHDND